MKLSVKAMAISAGLTWGILVMFLTGLANYLSSAYAYGQSFLEVMASLYPGYDPVLSLREVLAGTVYGLVDGAAAGGIFAWIYNRFVPASQAGSVE